MELAVIGVRKECHRKGTGRSLFAAAKDYAVRKGYEFIQVKTVRAGIYEDYDVTNEFRVKAQIDPPVAETAPALIVVLTRRINAYRDKCFVVQDYSAAVENMLLVIVELGLSFR